MLAAALAKCCLAVALLVASGAHLVELAEAPLFREPLGRIAVALDNDGGLLALELGNETVAGGGCAEKDALAWMN